MWQRLVFTYAISIMIISVIILTDSLSLYKYELDIDHIDKPEKDDLVNYGTLRVKKFNRSCFAVTGYIDLLRDFSDEYTAMFEIYSLSGNDYRKVLDRQVRKMCTFFKEDQMVVTKIINQTSMGSEIKECPIPAQRIHFYETHMPADKLPMDPGFLKKGMVRMYLYLENKLMTNVSIYFTLTRLYNN